MGSLNTYEQLSQERKQGVLDGNIPEWYCTPGYQLYKAKYQYENETVKQCFQRLARIAAQETNEPVENYKRFFKMMWEGWYTPSTPQYNLGTGRGMSVSCSGGVVPDSVDGFGKSYWELMKLTQEGFGTSSYLGDIRSRGSLTSRGFKASGVVPVIKNICNLIPSISQGNSRRGAWAGYLPITHGDFDEVCDLVEHDPSDVNMGFCIDDNFIEDLRKNNSTSVDRMDRLHQLRYNTGKGYLYFTDKVEKLQPVNYKHYGLKTHASNLCTEITLTSSDSLTFVCNIGSANLLTFDKWGDWFIKAALEFLDAMNTIFIRESEGIEALQKAREHAIKGRAVGLGTTGFHSHLQERGIVFDSVDAHLHNGCIYSVIKQEVDIANKELGKEYGSPDWCRPTGERFTHTTAIAPNTSSSLLAGGVSQGIEPWFGNVFDQGSAGGGIYRMPPKTIEILKKHKLYNKIVMDSIARNAGSVQHIDELTPHEKELLKTAFEVNQLRTIHLAAQRSRILGSGFQSQSLNLFFPTNEDPVKVKKVLSEAIKNPYIKTLYYQKTLSGAVGSNSCATCEN